MMVKAPEFSGMFLFRDFRLEADERRLSRGDATIPLTPKAFDLLVFLVQNEGRLLRKEDLLAAVWPGTAVEENNLSVAISALRKALGETENQRFIETVPKTGYRFVSSVTKLETRAEETESDLLPVRVLPFNPLQEDSKGFARHSRLLLVGLVISVLAVSAYLFTKKRDLPSHTAAISRRLAILPFQNLRGNAEDQFLSLSLADAVINKLASIRELTVRPSYDIRKYTTQSVDLEKIAADLAVDTVLTATFIHEEDNLRIAGQLVDVKTHEILWKGAFDFKFNRLLTVQEKVARQIVEGLELTLSPSEAARLQTAEKIDPLAYEYYLRGIDLYAKNDFQLAAKMLEKSLEQASTYAPSWANLGRTYTASASFQFGGDGLYQKAEAAFARAIALDPHAIDARVYMANMFTDTGRVEKAVPLLREAARSEPNHAECHWELGYAYRFAGMLEESVSECEHARRLDPAVKLNSSALNGYLYLGLYDRFLETLSPTDDVPLIVFYRGLGEYCRRNKQQATAHFDRAFELDHSMPQTRVGKALSFTIQRRRAEANAILRDLEGKTGSRGAFDPEAIYKIAQAYAVLGDKNSALRVLKRSIETGFFPHTYIQTDPLLDCLHSEPEFSTLINIAQRRHDAFRKMFF